MFVLTNRLRFGLCPEGTQVGNYIVTMCGCAQPVVLRPLPIPPDCVSRADIIRMQPRYRFIGPCVIDGEMYGESMYRHEWNDVLHAEPGDSLGEKHGCAAFGRGEFAPRFWDMI